MIITIPIFVFFAFPFFHAVTSLAKTALLISELLPSTPKFLANDNDTTHQKKVLDSFEEKVVVDVFAPKNDGKKSALIVATGVKIAFEDRPYLYKFAHILGELGYVVAWPRGDRQDKGQNFPESPETLVSTFEYLRQRPDVDPKKISFLGFSTGSSLAFVASSDPRISNDVRSLLFFGGYYDAVDLLVALKSKTIKDGQKKLSWNPSHEVTYYTKENFKNMGAYELANVIDDENSTMQSVSPEMISYLKKRSPSQYVNKIKAPVFIVHAYGDDRIPYVESQKLANSLPENIKKDFLLTNIFDHVRPKKSVSFTNSDDIKEVLSFFKLSYDLIVYL